MLREANDAVGPSQECHRQPYLGRRLCSSRSACLLCHLLGRGWLGGCLSGLLRQRYGNRITDEFVSRATMRAWQPVHHRKRSAHLHARLLCLQGGRCNREARSTGCSKSLGRSDCGVPISAAPGAPRPRTSHQQTADLWCCSCLDHSCPVVRRCGERGSRIWTSVSTELGLAQATAAVTVTACVTPPESPYKRPFNSE